MVKTKTQYSARTADKYILYTEAVQEPSAEVSFFRRIYNKHNNRLPLIMREDFCGTAAICCNWVKRGTQNRSFGVDLDPEPLQWSRTRYLNKLTTQQLARINLIKANVLTVKTPAIDVILALNFSFCVFKERTVLLKYMRRCLHTLTPGGIMVMDIYGGPESQQPNTDSTRKNGFVYVWDQARYNPISNETLCHIHFEFPDGSKMNKAFTYDWRLWTPVEIRETLLEAGFTDARIYWEGTQANGEGNGSFRVCESSDADDAWVAYVVGFR